MAYTKFRNGFNITSASAIDQRIYLTKEQMLTAEDDFNLPDVYICICPDDGKFYLYNVNNTPNAITGKYIMLDETIDFKSPVIEAKLDETIVENTHIKEIDSQLNGMGSQLTSMDLQLENAETNISELNSAVNSIQPTLSQVEVKVENTDALVNNEILPTINDLTPRMSAAEVIVENHENDIKEIQQWINTARIDGGRIGE